MIFFLSYVKSVPNLPSQPGFFATSTDERLLLRGRRVTIDHKVFVVVRMMGLVNLVNLVMGVVVVVVIKGLVSHP